MVNINSGSGKCVVAQKWTSHSTGGVCDVSAGAGVSSFI